MAESFSDFIERLLAKTDLVSVVSRYVPLKRKGKTFWGCCPFHHEKEPSFTVSEEKQFYHCFGCKESGNAITFIAKMESIERIDAIKKLAEEAKMEMPEYKKMGESGIDLKKRERLYALMKEAARHYNENLSSPRAKNANDYIKSRAIPENLVRKFGLGVSLDGKEIINYLESEGFTKAEMKDAGLIDQRGDDYYDVFYGRFMVPIINNYGEVIAFGGRLISPESHVQMKYRNSTNTPIFDKSKTLYGINLLKKLKQRQKINSVIIVEGYMDVIALHKAGFENSVASMGTALTYSQAKMLKNYANTVYVSYDGDSAGQMATLRGLDILSSVGLMVKVMTLPDGLDPDDLIKRDGAGAYQDAIDGALGLIEYKLRLALNANDITTPEGKTKYAIEAVKIIKKLPNPVEREEYLKIVHKNSGYSMEVLRSQAEVAGDEVEIKAEVSPKVENETTVKARSKDETFILACLISAKPCVKADDDIFPYLQNETDRVLCKYAQSKIANGEKPLISALYETFDADYVREIADYDFNYASDDALEQSYRDYLNRLKIRSLDAELKELTERFMQTKDIAIATQINKINSQIRKLKNGDEY